MNYSEVKKLDEDSAKALTEGSGPADECICNLLAPPDESKGLRGSIKRALASIGGRKPAGGNRGAPGGGTGGNWVGSSCRTSCRGSTGGSIITGGPNVVQIPLRFTEGVGGVLTTKEEVKRTKSCGKCGCDNEKFFLKHSYANIQITSPDISTICPCPSNCFPDKDRLNNNICVTVEHVNVSDNEANGATDAYKNEDLTTEEIKPVMDRSSAKELVEYVWKEWKSLDVVWSGNIEEEDDKTLDSKPEGNLLNELDDPESLDVPEEHEKVIMKKPNPE